MEVPGRKQDEGDDSVAGSQSFYELTCEPCYREEGKHLKAVAFCLGCEYYFCKACVKFHKRIGLKDHVLLEGDKMPKTKPAKGKVVAVKQKEECIDRCDKHRGELVKYYCKDHKVVGCTDCITLVHKSCSGTQLISEISRQKEANQLFDSFKIKLQELSATINGFLKESGVNKKEVDKLYQVALSNLRKYKSEIVQALNTLEKVIEKEARLQKEADMQAMDDISVSCRTISKNISDVEAEYDALKNGNKKSQLFTLVHRAKSQLEAWERQSRDIEMTNRIQRYTFEPEYLVRDTLQNPEGLGKLIRNQMKNKQTGEVSAKSMTARPSNGQSRWLCRKCGSGTQKVELACGHELCQDCAREQINHEKPCSVCGVITGSQPQGSLDTMDYGTDYIKMTFQFRDGIQMPHHPQPGQQYRGSTLVCYLRKDNDGQPISKLLQIAFDRKLIGRFKDGTVCDNVGLFEAEPCVYREPGYEPYELTRHEVEWSMLYREWIPMITKRLADLGVHA